MRRSHVVVRVVGLDSPPGLHRALLFANDFGGVRLQLGKLLMHLLGEVGAQADRKQDQAQSLSAFTRSV
jgi:hypothetical protein